jgi:hypothetical protein
MDPVRFTRHERNAMRFWRLTDDVLPVIAEPYTLVLSVKGRLNAWKQMPKGLIRATYISEIGQLVVVTVALIDHGLVVAREILNPQAHL